MKVALLCTGDEVLTGKTVNTNYSHVTRRLHECGFEITAGITVGDDRIALLEGFRNCAASADAVIVNGGLGPTVDDLSQQVAAEAAGVDLVLSEQWLGEIAAYYQRSGRTMPENNRKQAMLPAGSELIDNPIGTACGFSLNIHGKLFMFTPGVPRELKRMLEEQILPRLQSIRGGRMVTRLKRFHTFGIGESRADLLLQGISELDDNGPVKLGFQSHFPELETKLMVQATSESLADNLLQPVSRAVRECLGDFLVAEDDDKIELLIQAGLQDRGRRLCTLDTVTGGTLNHRFMSVTGSMVPVLGINIDQNQFTGDIDTECHKVMSMAGSDLCLAVVHQDTQVEENKTALLIAIMDGDKLYQRPALLPGRAGWVALGAAELAMVCLQRHLNDLPIHQKIDFEQQ